MTAAGEPMAEQEVTREDVRALIAEVFEHHPMPHMQRLETAGGLVVRFAVISKRLGGILCDYPIEPMAKALLQAYPNRRIAAYSMLAMTLARLPFGLHVGMENIADLAEYETVETDRNVRSLADNGGRPVDVEERKQYHKDTLKKMDARNREIMFPVTPGVFARVTPENISGGVGVLIANGKTKAEVTPQAVADLLKCSDSMIYKALKKRGITFEHLLEMY